MYGREQKVEEEVLSYAAMGDMYKGFVTAFAFEPFMCPEARVVRVSLHICTSCMQPEKR